MVSLYGLLGTGVLLAGPLVFRDMPTPQQAATESYTLYRYLGGAGPYLQNTGYGISTLIPEGCELEQVQLVSRHGERYPTSSNGKLFKALYKKLTNITDLTGPLALFNDYDYFVTDETQLDQLTTPKNCEGTFAGSNTITAHGESFRAKYGELFNETTEILNVFATTSQRVNDSSHYFARGFLGNSYDPLRVSYHIYTEDAELGANSLTPRYGCPAFENSTSPDVDDSFLDDIAERLMEGNSGLNLTGTEVSTLFKWCAYETNVRSTSQVCGLFSMDDWVRYSYWVDVTSYYDQSSGNEYAKIAGSQMVAASYKYLNESAPPSNVLLSFTHDTDIDIMLAALGLFENGQDLPTDTILFNAPYVHSQIVPQGARIITEKYTCGDSSYARYVVNDAVIPLPSCQDGPGFSCRMDKLGEYIEKRVGGVDYVEKCGAPANYSSTLSFFWDDYVSA